MSALGKVILCGGSTVGKTTLMNRISGQHIGEATSPTMAAGFSNVTIVADDKEYQFNVWDTAGQEAFRSLIKIYFRGVDVAIVLFDLTNHHTFEDIDSWTKEIKENAGNDTFRFILVGNKIDRVIGGDERAVTEEELAEKAKSLNAPFLEISALNNTNVDRLMQLICITYSELGATTQKMEKDEPPPSLNIDQNEQLVAPIIDPSPDSPTPEKHKKGCC